MPEDVRIDHLLDCQSCPPPLGTGDGRLHCDCAFRIRLREHDTVSQADRLIGEQVLFLPRNLLVTLVGYYYGDPAVGMVRTDSGAIWRVPPDQIAKVVTVRRIAVLADGEERELDV